MLKTIDPANAPEEKAKPKRALIVVLGTMLGGILSVLIVLIRYFTRKGTTTKLSNSSSISNKNESDSVQPTKSSQVLGK